MFCFFSLSEMFGGVWAPCFLFRQVMNLKNPCHIAPSERKKKKKRGSHSTLLRTRSGKQFLQSGLN